MRKTMIFLCSVFLALLLSAQGVRICPSCGWEVQTDALTCSHCQAKLPVAKVETKQAVTSSVTQDQAEMQMILKLAEQTVRSNIASFRRTVEEAPAIAYCYAVNAAAVQRLLPPEKLSEEIRKKIISGQRTTFSRLQKGRLPCRKCDSQGKIRMSVPKADGTTAWGPWRPCPVCRGRRYRIGYAPVSVMKLKLQKGRSHFIQERIAAGDVRLGHAFIPAGLADLLDTRQKALVMTGAHVPCPDCTGVGREECGSCKGSGWTKCKNSGCKNGILQEKSNRRKTTRLNDSVLRECPVCDGTGEVACPKCKGRGSLPCRKCNGSGTAQLCKRCVGEGLAPCRKCKGTGKVKGLPCPDCHGELVIFCPTCRGEGVIEK